MNEEGERALLPLENCPAAPAFCGHLMNHGGKANERKLVYISAASVSSLE